jgi:hypothetical protein
MLDKTQSTVQRHQTLWALVANSTRCKFGRDKPNLQRKWYWQNHRDRDGGLHHGSEHQDIFQHCKKIFHSAVDCRYFGISLVIPRRPELHSSIKMQQKFEEEMPRLAEAVRTANQDINKQSQTFAELDDCLRIRSLNNLNRTSLQNENSNPGLVIRS